MYCLYKHTNTSNGKSYIGITSREPEKRWMRGNGYRQNHHFYSAIIKYGWDGFRHEILYDNLDYESACELERKLVDELDLMNPQKGYNNVSGGNANRKASPQTIEKLKASHAGQRCGEDRKRFVSALFKGRKLTEEHKAKISAGNKGKVRTKETREKLSKRQKGRIPKNIEQLRAMGKASGRKVNQIDLKTRNILRTYNSLKEAERETGIHHQNIRACCKGISKFSGGYLWRYENEEVPEKVRR